MKKIKKAKATECAVTLFCEEDGREEKWDLLFDAEHMVVTSRTFAPDIREWDRFAEEKHIPELVLIPYHLLYKSGYGDERFLTGAADALRFYRGDDAEEAVKQLAPFFPQVYQPDPALKVIDFDLRGNQVILRLGLPTLKAYGGNGWEEAPYEFYAGKVEDRYVADAVVLNFPADATVYQACEARDICPDSGIPGNASKNELRAKKIPCIVYELNGGARGEIYFDDVIGDVTEAAGVPVSKLRHLI